MFIIVASINIWSLKYSDEFLVKFSEEKKLSNKEIILDHVLFWHGLIELNKSDKII